MGRLGRTVLLPKLAPRIWDEEVILPVLPIQQTLVYLVEIDPVLIAPHSGYVPGPILRTQPVLREYLERVPHPADISGVQGRVVLDRLLGTPLHYHDGVLL